MKEEIKDFKKELTDITGQMSKIDFERMSFFLRFQNVPELPNENLRELMATMLVDYIKKDKEFIWGDIDLIYRINSAFARINEVPREIHIKLIRRSNLYVSIYFHLVVLLKNVLPMSC